MSQDEMRRLFDAVLDGAAPDSTDVDGAIRSGLRRRRTRRGAALVSSAAVLAVISVWATAALPQASPPVVAGPSPTATAPPPRTAVPVTDLRQIYGSWWALELAGRDVEAARTRFGGPLVAWFGPDQIHGGSAWAADDGCNSHSGSVSVRDGRLRVGAGMSTLVGCPQSMTYPENPAAIEGAREARLLPAADGAQAELVLLADGEELGRYRAVPDADVRRGGGTVLTSSQAVEGDGMAAVAGGELQIASDGCVRLGGLTTIFPAGTGWSFQLGMLVLPDGRTALPGQTVTGGGGALRPAVAKTWIADQDTLGACTWTDEVFVFNRGEELAVE